MKLLGLTDEQRLAIEETTGIKTEGVRRLFETANQQAQQIAEALVKESIKEVQSVVGPHGSVTRLQAGGVNISQGLGVSVYESGVLKTTIEPDGDLLVGSDITQPSTTSFCVFVNEQTYSNEAMGAGDMLIGDNSTGASNVKYDASEGQLQFRFGTTVNVYMDTDGSLRAGGGVVTLDDNGISILAATAFADTNSYKFIDSNGNVIVAFQASSAGGGSDVTALIVSNNNIGANDTVRINSVGETRGLVELNAYNPTDLNLARIAALGNDTTSYIELEGANVKVRDAANYIADFSANGVIINDPGRDIDVRIESDTDANNLFSDGGANRVGIGTATPGYKLDVNGDVNVPSGSTYKVNGATVVSGTVTGVTNGDSHNHVGGDGAALSYSYVIGTFLNGVSVPASTTYYSCPFKIGADGTTNSFPWPEPGTLSDMSFRMSTNQPASGSLVITLVVNGSTTALTITVPAGTAGPLTSTDNTHTVALSANDTLMWQFVNNATAGSANMTAVSMRNTKQTT